MAIPCPMFHGSPTGGLTRLDPEFCVVDPAAWAGTDATGAKLTRAVVWLTSSRDVAIAFALKGFAQDLGIDTRHGVLYLQREGPLPPDAAGWVYTVDSGPHIHHARGVEWYTEGVIHPRSYQRVTPADLQELRIQIVAGF